MCLCVCKQHSYVHESAVLVFVYDICIILFNRYNVGCSKRIGLFRNQEESPSKRMREEGSADVGDAAPQLEPAESQGTEVTDMETGGEAVDGDGTSNLESPSKSQRVDILKWTVRH